METFRVSRASKGGFSVDFTTLKGTLALMKHVFYKRYGLGYKKGKMTHGEFIKSHERKVVELTSFKEMDEFLRNLPKRL